MVAKSISSCAATTGLMRCLPRSSSATRSLSSASAPAGPLLRGLWMFAECFGLAAVLALLVVRGRRWWTQEEEVAS